MKYIHEKHDFLERDDWNLNSPSDFEATIVEILLPNLIMIGYIYRHPSSKVSIDNFIEKCIQPIIHKMNKEKKECVLMGDYNIDFFKCTGNDAARKFYHSLQSYFFTPHLFFNQRGYALKLLIDKGASIKDVR